MATLTLELRPDVFQKLSEEAKRAGKSPQVVAQEWLNQRLEPQLRAHVGSRAQAHQVLLSAGLLPESDTDLDARATTQVTLAQVEAALARAGGQPLSEIAIEQRGPKA